MKQQTNVLLFPSLDCNVVELCEYWYRRGYTIGNTRHNNLCLVELVE